VKQKRASVFGIDFDSIDQGALISEVVNRVRAGKSGYIVTANLHLVIKLKRDAELRLILADPTALVVPDGRPILWMARLHGFRLQLVTGSDLVIPLCRVVAHERQSIFLFGTTFRALSECARRLSTAIEGLRIAGIYSPPFGFERDPEECARATSVIRAASPDIVFVALGQPKQEVWAQKHARELNIQAVCVGAGLDFVAGAQWRAPAVVRQIGLEWLWRALTEPRRLGGRYLTILYWMPFLVIGDLATIVRIGRKQR
jgi:N-acetylglucosaminyldiphosphoundecaprenol N-acetyl-beta-D-mannosaminyltransferase